MLPIFFITAFVGILATFPRCFRLMREARPGRSFMARVVRVVDGDTVDVVRDGFDSPLRLRLKYIDAPELNQEHGMESSKALEALSGQVVVVVPYALDVYGRTLAEIGWDGQAVNLGMVRYGYAWADDDAPRAYKSALREAQAERLGIWSGGTTYTPAQFRAGCLAAGA